MSREPALSRRRKRILATEVLHYERKPLSVFRSQLHGGLL